LNYWLGRYREALDDISQALALRPDHPGDLHNRAVVLASLGRQAEAIREYELVIRLEPSSAGTLNNLAWLLATARDPALRDCRRAIDCARKAVAVIRSAAWLDTLAAAHAECGDFERAIEIETEACALTQPLNPAFEKRLELYKRGISYASWITKR
jgi:tetratricopeptide (TPR) repeat protein